MFKKYKLFICQFGLLAFLLLALIGVSCNRRTRIYKSPDGYNLSKPYVIKLPSELDEISGIDFYGKDNSLFAESDEKGCLYKIFLNKPTDIRKWKFSHKRDYEDIVLHDSTIYVLNNNGDIISLRFLKDSLVTHEYTFPENGKYEFESLYYDDKLQKLLLMCKDCDVDQKNTVSVYSFDLQQFRYSLAYTIDTRNANEMVRPGSIGLKPSGATINPVTGELYILSSYNKLLVVAKRTGEITATYRLDPALFTQPEGIAFSPNGNMFISNEAGDIKSATILFYQYQNNGNK